MSQSEIQPQNGVTGCPSPRKCVFDGCQGKCGPLPDNEGELIVAQGIKWPQRPLIDIRPYGFALKTSKPNFRSSWSKPVEAGEKPYERILKKCTIGQ